MGGKDVRRKRHAKKRVWGAKIKKGSKSGVVDRHGL